MRDSRNLDLLRALAVMLVVGSHVAANLELGGANIELAGRVGVAVFFVHTCLVLMFSLDRAPSAVPFFVRRFFRIYPLSAAIVVLVALGLGLGGGGDQRLDPLGLLSNLLLVQNLTGHSSMIGPLWSLPYEVQMYLALPALHLLARRGAGRIAALLAGVVAALAALMALGLPTRLLDYVPCFLAGVLAYALPRRDSVSPLWLVALVAVAALGLPVLESAGVPEAPFLWAICLALGLLIPACREVRSQVVSRAAHVVAKYSYGIYLTHMFAIAAGFKLFPSLPAWASWIVFVAVLVAWARVAYRWIEAPGIALGARLAERYRARITAPRPAAMSPAASSTATPEVVRGLVKSTTEAALSSSR